MAHAFFLMLLVNASWAFLLPVKPRCRVLCSAAETPDEFSFSALRREAEKRRAQEGLGKFDLMRKIGPHHTTSPKEVVEHVVMELRAGELSQAFAFTSMPPWRQVCTALARQSILTIPLLTIPVLVIGVLTVPVITACLLTILFVSPRLPDARVLTKAARIGRSAWHGIVSNPSQPTMFHHSVLLASSHPACLFPEGATIINGQPSGMILTFDNFVQMVRTQYAQLLQTDQCAAICSAPGAACT